MKEKIILTNLHFIGIDKLNVDEMLMIWLYSFFFVHLFGFDKLNVGEFE